MSTLPDRAWRFIHPDFEAAAGQPGIGLTNGGAIAMVEGHDAVRQSILLLLSTVPGERVMRPDYGCQLHSLAFAPNDDTTAGLAIHYVRRALERWEPRIDILRIDASGDPDDPRCLNVTLEYRVRATAQRDTLEVEVSLAGEQA